MRQVEKVRDKARQTERDRDATRIDDQIHRQTHTNQPKETEHMIRAADRHTE